MTAAARIAGEGKAAATAAHHDAAAAVSAAGCYLLTGGADASIKCWTLADWLPATAAPEAATAKSAPAAAAECFTLQGLPPCPDATEVGQSRCYGLQPAQRSTQQAHQAGQSQQEQQVQEGGGSATARDSRAEWARCLALASSSSSSGGDSASGSSGGGMSRRWRRRWLYVATNRGLVHRVQLPGDLVALCWPAGAVGVQQDSRTSRPRNVALPYNSGPHTTERLANNLSLQPSASSQQI